MRWRLDDLNAGRLDAFGAALQRGDQLAGHRRAAQLSIALAGQPQSHHLELDRREIHRQGRGCAQLGVATPGAMAKGGWQEFTSAASLQRPQGAAAEPTPKAQQRVRVQRTKAGKGGKLVTAISGLEAPEAELKALLKQLKARAGTGGTLKDGLIELQGDQVAAALEALTQAGYRPKQAGG